MTVSAAALPSIDAPAQPPTPTLVDVAQEPALAALLAEGLAAEMGHGGAAALQALLRAEGIEAAPIDVQPADVPGVPVTLALPLGRLVAANAVAEQLRAEALAALAPDERQLILDGLLQPSPAAARPAPQGTGELAAPNAGAWVLDPRAAGIAAKVDVQKLRVAALTILEAIDEAWPALEAAALADAPATQVAACPGIGGAVVFASSNCLVIVANTGANTYTSPAAPALLVDLGGNDVYSIPAGLGSGGVQTFVDVAGNDAYAQAASASAAGIGATVAAQGAGILGVGVLADLAGSDAYTATASTTAPQPGPVAGQARVLAQGLASAGAGVLLDAGGRDTFTATTTSSGGSVQTLAQGQAGVGLGALLNLGNEAGADDVYRATSTSTLHLISRTTSFSQYSIGAADTQGQAGAGLAGVAALADAGGDDAYTALASGGVANAVAQGAASQGAALLADAQGNDNLFVQAAGDTTLTLVTTDPSLCWTVTVTVTVGDTRTLAQGAAATGLGGLVDGTGNDARVALASSVAGAIADATSNFDCTAFGGNKAIATATSGTGSTNGQGWGATGVGVLADVLGSDFNNLGGISKAHASAKARSPGPDVETPTATAGSGLTQGQGGTQLGIGLSVDLDGADTYRSYTDSSAIRENSAGLTTTTGTRVQNIQGFGTGGGLGWLFEGAGADTYTTTPAGASGAVNSGCWANGPNGKGRDWAALLPPGCL